MLGEASIVCKSSLIEPSGASFLFHSWWRRPLSLSLSQTWYFSLGSPLLCLWGCEMSLSEEKAPSSLWKPLENLYEYVLKGCFFSRVGTEWVGSWGGFMWNATIYLRFSCEAHMTGFLCIFFLEHSFMLSCALWVAGGASEVKYLHRCFTFRIYCKKIF